MINFRIPVLLAVSAAMVALVAAGWSFFIAPIDEQAPEERVSVEIRADSASIAAPEQPERKGPNRPGTTGVDTPDRHGAFKAARAQWDPDLTVDTPSTVTLFSHSPVVVFDKTLSEDLAQYMPETSLQGAEIARQQGSPVLLWYGNPVTPESALPLNVTSVFAEDDWLGLFLAGPDEECVWHPAEEVWAVQDAFGVHPLLVDNGGSSWESILPAKFFGVSESRRINWSSVPARGDQFDRQWKSQMHLVESPHRDGIIFRYEGGLRYLPRAQRGRGNSAHHWNLLAYALVDVAPESDGFRIQPCASQLARGIFPQEWIEQYRNRFSEDWYQTANQ